MCLNDNNDVAELSAAPLRAHSCTGDVMEENPSNLLTADSKLCVHTRADSRRHAHARAHRLNMAVNEIVDAFSFGAIQTEITACVGAEDNLGFASSD